MHFFGGGELSPFPVNLDTCTSLLTDKFLCGWTCLHAPTSILEVTELRSVQELPGREIKFLFSDFPDDVNFTSLYFTDSSTPCPL